MACSHTPRVQAEPAAPYRAVGGGPVIIGHRGGSLEAPENTLASIQHSVQIGTDWQEIDVALTSDGVPVVIHDDTLERTTSGEGEVEKKPWEYVKKLKAGRPKWFEKDVRRLSSIGVQVPQFGELYHNETVPSLEQVLSVEHARLMVELKPTTRFNELARSVSEVFSKTQAFDRVVVGSFSVEVVEAMHRVQPSVPLMAIIDNIGMLDAFMHLPLSVVACHVDMASAVLEKVPPGVAVWVWTVYTAEVAETLALSGVHGIITDAPSQVLRALRPATP